MFDLEFKVLRLAFYVWLSRSKFRVQGLVLSRHSALVIRQSAADPKTSCLAPCLGNLAFFICLETHLYQPQIAG
jgi:hypothetical protein